MIEYRTGDIFKANVEALVNPVNCVGVMGAGLASQFKAAFPKNFYAYAKACKQGQVQLGKMFIYKNQTELNPQYIINFPTKKHWLNKSRFQDIVAGLEALKLVLQENYISSVAIPALGCGLGGLKWSEVKPVTHQILQSLNIYIVLYEPWGKSTVQVKQL
jgi:O-acetyl-ADP-ribose deacetylase (regulator of RNase III)